MVAKGDDTPINGVDQSNGVAPGTVPQAKAAARKAASSADAGKAAGEVDSDIAGLVGEILDGEQEPAQARHTGPNWFHEIFDKDYPRTRGAGWERAVQREADFIVASMGLKAGARILDLGCGDGIHAVALAERGFEVLGVDSSEPLLEQAQKRAAAAGAKAAFALGDMRELALDAQFDAVICMNTTLGYFNDRQNYQVVERCFKALTPGGQIIIDVVNRDWVINEVPLRVWWEDGGVLLMEEVGFDSKLSRLQVQRSLVIDESIPFEQSISIRMYSSHELVTMLRLAGFQVSDVTGDLAHPGVYLGPGNRRLLVRASRPE